jgi:hypothetical protein
MPAQLRLRIVLEKPPAGVDYALQKGSGSNYQCEQLQRGTGADLRFEFTVSDALRGPYVQGPKDGRFVYIDIGTAAGQLGTCWSRRLKVPLAGITPEMIASGAILEARVNGTARDGGPACATPKPFAGWHVVKA